MTQVTTFTQVDWEGTSTTISTTKEDMSVGEFLQLFGQFYRGAGYCNDLRVKIKGSIFGDEVIKIRGNTDWEEG